jgi:type VI secretion system Hcp family effector
VSITTRGIATRSAVLAAAALFMGASELTQAAQDLLAIQISGVPGDAAFATANALPPASVQVLAANTGLLTVVDLVNGGVSVGKTNFQQLNISKNFNNSSPALALAEITGKVIPTAILSFYTGTPGAWTRYYTVTLTNAYVTTIALGDSAGGNAIENVYFFYSQIRYTDNLTGATECFNLVTNTTC